MSEQQTQNAPAKDTSSNLSGGYSDSRAAFSPRVKEFKEAMSLLYIRNNASGRNKFRQKWPEVAKFIFGEELIRMDNEGTQDRELRAKLENEAGLRRIALKVVLEEYEEKSVKSGSLEFDYVGRILDRLGSDIAKLLYAENIIERVRPGMISKTLQDDADKVQAAHDKQEQADDALRARSALSAQEDESFESSLSASDIAEKVLADQERMALRPLPQEVPLANLHEELRQSEQFTSMRIEISDDVRPIETESVDAVVVEASVVLSQDLDAAAAPVLQAVQAPEIVQEVAAKIETVVEQSPAVTAAPPLPPLEAEKKPRLQIAGLRIKDEQPLSENNSSQE